ncbi:hypothetical protein ATZ36_12025 [Candidatus Endomicrobiellum trichonymphae]|uniref:Uncharacterized protein n=1 Tax=Endomicrobium trichonymphae TaxID=1408204 RepID=A0A1E5IN61_ENDTX|nr:hypothetical protein ATZ36_12025 [Candidatus Endomicrobium trichonymphae]
MALGANALDKHANCFALINDWTEIIFIENGNYVKHNCSMAAEASLNENSIEFKQVQGKLLSLNKALTSSLQDNK